MWLLSTACTELRYFTNPAAVTEGYAILSHTWDHDGEQTYQDIQAIIARCRNADENPRNHVGEKIRRYCEVAERDGYAWVWIDSCCIDKTSSTELSEAINSMFTWYSLAEVCYVFLEDVHFDDNPFAEESQFRRARWHTRGWTLQELLAPAFVVFLSLEWKPIGSKHDLCIPLWQCTGIYSKYLTREWDFLQSSVARRMSWAADRKTTRVEDEAYCLLGLLGINMSTLYGEGRHAFQRLQAELVKHKIDTSLFAWGSWHCSRDDDRPRDSLSKVHTGFHGPTHTERFLFAPSPRVFKGRFNVCYTPYLSPSAVRQPYLRAQGSEEYNARRGCNSEERQLFGQAHTELPSFEITPYGMKCRFPVAEVDGIIIAVLLCETPEQHLGLLLHPAPDTEALDQTRETYCVSWAFQEGEFAHTIRRVACLGGDLYDLRFRGKPVVASWRDIYIMAHPHTTSRSDGAHLVHRFALDVAPAPFRIPRCLLQALAALELFPWTWTTSTDPASIHTIRLTLENFALMEGVRIMFGLCTKSTPKGARPRHWAWAEPKHLATWHLPWSRHAHDCATDHIEDWPDCRRAFGETERTIRLVFAPCPHASGRTLVLGLELEGSVYERMQWSTGTRLPLHPKLQRQRIEALDLPTPPPPTSYRAEGSRNETVTTAA